MWLKLSMTLNEADTRYICQFSKQTPSPPLSSWGRACVMVSGSEVGYREQYWEEFQLFRSFILCCKKQNKTQTLNYEGELVCSKLLTLRNVRILALYERNSPVQSWYYIACLCSAIIWICKSFEFDEFMISISFNLRRWKIHSSH